LQYSLIISIYTTHLNRKGKEGSSSYFLSPKSPKKADSNHGLRSPEPTFYYGISFAQKMKVVRVK